MARNEEKAQSLMNRWVTMKADYSGLGDRRPFIASDVKTIGEAEKWRRQLVNEISSKVAGIQNASALGGEHAIREMNDKINRLFREKWHWDKRITELGGMKRTALPLGVEEGVQLPGSGTYRYYGAAKNLPGVRELIEAMNSNTGRSKRVIPEHHECLNPDYFGYRDENDSELLRLEAIAEEALSK